MSRLPLDTILSDWWDSYVFSTTHKNFAHENPLILSARAGCTSICKRLILQGDPINNCGNYRSALAAAAYKEHLEVRRGLNLIFSLLTENYGSALATAAYMDHFEVVQLLLEKGAKPDLLLLTGNYGSALAATATNENLEITLGCSYRYPDTFTRQLRPTYSAVLGY
ncbi:Major facilitator superfamily domain general substrate transporter [Penicillium malachiteum]|nr:Major facilitator superfamily domain general substrate transporter [Penicillium malachiteum]